jgi:hypothetical protein
MTCIRMVLRWVGPLKSHSDLRQLWPIFVSEINILLASSNPSLAARYKINACAETSVPWRHTRVEETLHIFLNSKLH